MKKFVNRQEAGTTLAKMLKKYTNNPNAILLALPRGGVPVAFEIAKELAIPLDVFIVRKLGVPSHKELAFGAIATGGTLIYNDEIIRSLNLSQADIQKVIHSEQKELARREALYRCNSQSLENKIIILVDDGIATGATMLAAIEALHQQKPAYLVVAVPVAEASTADELAGKVDDFICPLKPTDFRAVGLWYDDFAQTSDAEVIDLLSKLKMST